MFDGPLGFLSLCARRAMVSTEVRREASVVGDADSEPETRFGSVGNPIRAMEADHEIAGNALENIRGLSNNYTPPNWACNTYRALLDGLRELELDLHQRIHKGEQYSVSKGVGP